MEKTWPIDYYRQNPDNFKVKWRALFLIQLSVETTLSLSWLSTQQLPLRLFWSAATHIFEKIVLSSIYSTLCQIQKIFNSHAPLFDVVLFDISVHALLIEKPNPFVFPEKSTFNHTKSQSVNLRNHWKNSL